MSRERVAPEDTRQSIANALTERYGEAFAGRWLLEQRAERAPVPVRRASDLSPPADSSPEMLSGPLRPPPDELATARPGKSKPPPTGPPRRRS